MFKINAFNNIKKSFKIDLKLHNSQKYTSFKYKLIYINR